MSRRLWMFTYIYSMQHMSGFLGIKMRAKLIRPHLVINDNSYEKK